MHQPQRNWSIQNFHVSRGNHFANRSTLVYVRRLRVYYLRTVVHVIKDESLPEGIRGAELRAHHDVVVRLVPEVVPEGGGMTVFLPRALHREVATVEQHEPA